MLKWLRQCGSALEYLGVKKMIHRDIKPMNIFLTFTNDAKLGDFGLTLSTISKSSIIQLSNARGTVTYISPETVKDTIYSHKSDIWFVVPIYISNIILLLFKVTWSIFL